MADKTLSDLILAGAPRTKAALMAEAYRRNILPPDKAKAFEAGVKAGTYKADGPTLALIDARKRASDGAIGRPYVQGATFNFADEIDGWNQGIDQRIKGALRSVGLMGGKDAKAPGYSPKEFSSAVTQAEREAEADFAGKHPIVDTGLRIAGALRSPGAASSVRYIGAAPTLLGRAARSGIVGAGAGAVNGAGAAQGDIPRRAKGAAIGGAIGGVTGPVVPLAGRGLQVGGRLINRASGQRIVGPEGAAISRLRQALRADGVSQAQVNQTVAEWQRLGNDAPTLMDVAGNHTMRLIRGVASNEGPAQNAATQYQREAIAARPSRGQNRVQNIVPNGPTAPQTSEFLEARRGQLASQEYAAPYGEMVAVDQRMVDALQDAPGLAALNRARQTAIAHRAYDEADEIDRVIEARGRTQTSLSEEIPMLRAGTVDRIYRQMRDNGMALSQDPGTRSMGVGVANRARDIDATLSNVEGLRPARATYQNLSNAMDAVDTGQTVLKASPDDFGPAFQGATPEVQQAGVLGARQTLKDKFGDRSAAGGLMADLEGDPNIRQNLTTLLGQGPADDLAGFAGNENLRTRNANLIAPNIGSQTAPRLQDQAATDVMSTVKRPVSAIIGRMLQGLTLSEAERAALVNIGLMPADQGATALQQRANPGLNLLSGTSDRLPWLAGGILGQQQPH